GRARGPSRGPGRGRTDRDRPQRDPRAPAALGGRAIRPDRGARADSPRLRLHAEGAPVDPDARALRDPDFAPGSGAGGTHPRAPAGGRRRLGVSGAAVVEPFLEAVAQVVAAQPRQEARLRRWDSDDAHVARPRAVA